VKHITEAVFMVVLILGFIHCESAPPRTVQLIATAVDPEGAPLAGAAVRIDERPVGVTDDLGQVKTRIRGPEGRRVRISADCPPAYTLDRSGPTTLTVRFLKSMISSETAESSASVNEAFLPLRSELRCDPENQSFVLLVKTNGHAGIPVTVGGRAVSVTDGDGVAQTVVTGPPGQEMEVVLDTSRLTDLRPSMPSRRLMVPKTRQILVFEQSFKKIAEKKKQTKRRRTLGPRRI
jgi:hypothetical protein